MRRTAFILGLMFALVLLGSGLANAQTSGTVTGFGGLTLNTSLQPLFGGNVAFGLTRNIEVVGEVGRINSVLPSLVNSLVSLTPADLRVSAFYGEGGVRLITDSRAPIAAYVETTAGLARLSTRLSGISGAPYADAALGLFDHTSPMLGVGGGVLFGAGPIALDLGYRYKRIIDNNLVDRALMLGQNTISVNQVRIGVGVRF